jgi:hypothetical protein
MPDDTLAHWRVPLDRAAESPAVEPTVPRVRLDRPHPAPSPTAKFVVHPRYKAWLARCGVHSADAALSLAGEVVSGHTDRHVMRVDLRGGTSSRTAYLKREHVTGLKWRAKNWAAGFGWVSRCEREANTLESLETAGLPGPQWLAYGEDGTGRAFLLVDDLTGSTDLTTLLRDHPPQGRLTDRLAERVGTALAELHASGFATPDLAAKHLFVGDGDDPVSVIDWPSAPKPGRVRDVDVVRWLGGLHAGVLPELADDRLRLRALWAYRRACRRLGRPVPYRFGSMAKAVHAAAERRQSRSSVRTQRHTTDLRQRLVWVAGEAVVAIPEVAAEWPTPAECSPFYPPSPAVTPPHGKRERVTLPGGRSAVLVRFHTVDPVGRMVAVVRERPWRSPAATAARVLFHLQRHGLPAPRLLAFGQRCTSAVAAESFVCADMPPAAVALATFLARPSTTPAASAAVLAECGRLLRQLHDAGLRPVPHPSPNDPLFVVSDDDTTSVAVGSPFAVKLVKRVSDAQRAADLRRFITPLDRTAGGWVSGGYHGAGG